MKLIGIALPTDDGCTGCKDIPSLPGGVQVPTLTHVHVERRGGGRPLANSLDPTIIQDRTIILLYVRDENGEVCTRAMGARDAHRIASALLRASL